LIPEIEKFLAVAIFKMAITISQKFNIDRYHHNLICVCDIVAAILKRATSRNCSMAGLNLEHHYLPTYQIVMISVNVEYLQYCDGHFENGDC
jgi:hypothetical protein